MPARPAPTIRTRLGDPLTLTRALAIESRDKKQTPAAATEPPRRNCRRLRPVGLLDLFLDLGSFYRRATLAGDPERLYTAREAEIGQHLSRELLPSTRLYARFG